MQSSQTVPRQGSKESAAASGTGVFLRILVAHCADRKILLPTKSKLPTNCELVYQSIRRSGFSSIASLMSLTSFAHACQALPAPKPAPNVRVASLVLGPPASGSAQHSMICVVVLPMSKLQATSWMAAYCMVYMQAWYGLSSRTGVAAQLPLCGSNP
jgi:hypothetical protein